MDRISRLSRDVLVQAGVPRGDRSRNEAVLFLALSEKAVGQKWGTVDVGVERGPGGGWTMDRSSRFQRGVDAVETSLRESESERESD